MAPNMLLSFILFCYSLEDVYPRVYLLNVNEIKKPVLTKMLMYGIPIVIGDQNSFFVFSVPITDFLKVIIWMHICLYSIWGGVHIFSCLSFTQVNMLNVQSIYSLSHFMLRK